MIVLQQTLFVLALLLTGWMVFRRAVVIRNTIRLGRDEDLMDAPKARLATMLRVAFAQKKMFDRPLAGMLHFMVYAGFVLINLEVLEIVLDGIAGTHRLFAPVLGGFYTFLIGFFEALAVGVILACSVFLIRRRNRGVARLQSARHREMTGWPEWDARVILLLEIVLMSAILTMNAADQVLQEIGHPHYTQTGNFAFSQWLKPLFEGWNAAALVVFERMAWWVHILGIFAFAVYVTYSKHLHILLAFPNTFFARRQPRGKMNNMPAITNEVKLMLGMEQEAAGEATAVPDRFGARDVTDLSWKSLLDAYSCTECGRCTAVCPANITGKKLSPRKIMMDTRDRLEEVGRVMDAAKGEWKEDGKYLLGDYIHQEELLACTTCNACVEACPILINPLDIILELRRYRVMEESQAPASWNMMFQNLETNQAPWKFAPSERFNWSEAVKPDAAEEES